MQTVTVNSIEELRARIAASDGTPVTITLAPGDYYATDETIRIEDKKNIRILGEDGACLLGGKRLSGVRKVTDPAILARIPEMTRDSAYEINLFDSGCRDIVERLGSGNSVLFQVNGQLMHRSQYPKRGSYLKTTGWVKEHVPEIDDGWGKKYGIMEDGVKFKDEHVRTWAKPEELYVNGFWIYDWMISCEPVVSFDPDAMLFTLTMAPGHYYNGLEHAELNLFRVGQRFHFYNIIEELDEPNAFFLNRTDGRLIFIAPAGETPDTLVISTLTAPLFSLKNAEHITLENLTMQLGNKCAVHGKEGLSDISVLMCEIANTKGGAVELHGDRMTLRGCSIHDTGTTSVCISSGDRKTLTRGDSLIAENHIYRPGRLSLTSGCLSCDGVGNTIRNNLLHDSPHAAIYYSGNCHTIIHNELYNLVMETGDAGAIYSGRDYSARGNVIRENYIHHLGGVGIGAMGVYNDDCLSGIHMERNIFDCVQRACMLGGGRDLVVDGNLFLNCKPALEIDSRGEPDAQIWRGIMRDLKGGVDRYLRTPVFAERFPETKEIVDFFDEEELPHIPPSATIEHNVFCGSRNLGLPMGGISTDLTMRDNTEIEPEAIPGAKSGDYTVDAHTFAFKRGFANIDRGEIGLAGAPCRSHPVDVFSSFRFERGGEWNYLVFEVRNCGNETATVEYRFDVHIPEFYLDHFEHYTFRATLAPGERKTASFDCPGCMYQEVASDDPRLKELPWKYRVFAYSTTPGARPAEIYNVVTVKKYGI